MDFSKENTKLTRSPSPFMRELSQSPSHLGIINEENEDKLRYPNKWVEQQNLAKFHLSLRKEPRSDKSSVFTTGSASGSPGKCHINNKKYLDVVKEMI